MEPEVQKLAVTALIGLLLLFPVFNQVQATSLDALRDADHKAKFQDFIKDWGDVPEDEKLAYWDGRNKPPGDGDFDRDDVDDDARIHQPDGEPRPGDRDGDGVPDDEDPDADDPNVTDEVRAVRHEVELWHFVGDENGQRSVEAIQGPAEANDYEHVNITWSYGGFTGTAEFELRSSGTKVWSLDVSTGAPYAVAEDDEGDTQQPQVPVDGLEIEYDYAPLTEPDDFEVRITGTYVVYEPVEQEP